MLLITVVSGPDRARTFRLPLDTPHLIGRQTGAISLNDPKASRRHAELRFTDGRLVITDLGSSNGTLVQHQKIDEPTALYDGATFQVGQTQCLVSLLPDPAELAVAAPVIPAELLEAQDQTRQMLAEVRDALARMADAPQPGSAAQAGAEAGETPVLNRLDEVLQRLGRLTEIAEQAEYTDGPEPDTSLVRDLSPKLDAILTAQEQTRAENPATAKQWSDLCGALASLAPVTDQGRVLAEIQQSLAAIQPAPVSQIEERLDALALTLTDQSPIKSLEAKLDALVPAIAPVPLPVDVELHAKVDAAIAALNRDPQPVSFPLGEIEQRLDAMTQIVVEHPSLKALEAKLDALAAVQPQGASSDRAVVEQLAELRLAVDSLAAAQDPAPVLAQLREAMSAVSAALAVSAPVDLVPALTDLHHKLDGLLIYSAASAKPHTPDTELHAKLDAVLAAVGNLAQPRPEPQPQGTPEWVAPLREAIAEIRPVPIERHLESIAQAITEHPAIESLEAKIDALLLNAENDDTAILPAIAASAEAGDHPDTARLEEKLDAVLHAIHAAPAPAPEIDAAVLEKLDALLAAANNGSPESGAETRLVEMEQKLDDLLAIVAANTLPAEQYASPYDAADMDAKLDAVLQAVQALSEAMVHRNLAGGEVGDGGAAEAGEHEALLLRLVERVDELASKPQDPLVVERLIEEVHRHSETLDERLMQHVRGSTEAGESQMRAALTDLTEAVRAMARRSDRVLLEQVLTELRARETSGPNELLHDMSERLKRLPAAVAAAANSDNPSAILLAVRDAVADGLPALDAAPLHQLAEQVRALPDRLNNARALNDIYALLRAVERNQQQQAEWIRTLSDRLDASQSSYTISLEKV